MGRRALLTSLLLLLPAIAHAQDRPRAEIAGDAALLLFGSEGEATTLFGGGASLVLRLGRLTLVGDLALYGRSLDRGDGLVSDMRVSSAAGGLRLGHWRRAPSRLVLDVLAGGASARETIALDPPNTDVTESRTGWTIIVSGSVDRDLSRRLAVRLVRADYQLTRLGDDTLQNFRVSAGLVWRLGAP